MRVRVDQARCQGHAMCALVCSDVFRLNDDDGHAIVITEIVPEMFVDSVFLAQKSCPEQAIDIDP